MDDTDILPPGDVTVIKGWLSSDIKFELHVDGPDGKIWVPDFNSESRADNDDAIIISSEPSSAGGGQMIFVITPSNLGWIVNDGR